MSHFTVLASITLPVNEASQTVSLPPPDGASNMPEILMPVCNAETSYLDTMADYLVEERLAPYCECTDDEDYLEFCDVTQTCKTQYETEGVDCIRMPDGRIVPFYDYRFSTQYELYEGKVYKRQYGPSHHRKRTKKAKQFRVLPNYPFKKMYASFSIFMEEYGGYSFYESENAYGYYCNPNTKWDWYQIGGRWPFRFLVKDECSQAISGEPSHLFKEIPSSKGPDGYRWVAGARKCDIAWDVMKAVWCKAAVTQFRQYEEWFAAHTIPPEKWDYRLTEEGIVCWGDLVYRKDDSMDTYLQRQGLSDEFKFPIGTFAYVDENGWEASGDMGWFGMSYNNKDELDWSRMVEGFIAALPDDAFLVSIDCHI